jgi:pyrroline-5-carboxylate reductase
MATAVSGSGPAYVFLFIESLVNAAVQLGLPQEVARELAVETVLGAGRLVRESGEEPAKLRKLVTSPGGTTAAALLRLEEGEFAALISRAVTAAYERARELGA